MRWNSFVARCHILSSYLKTVTLRLVLVFAIQSLHINVVGERVPQRLATLDVQLDI